jgi:FlaA1/EpsC-like NDP-sugar epimerase
MVLKCSVQEMVDGFLSALFQLTRLQKRAAQICADIMSLLISFTVAMALRLESFAFIGDGQVWLTAGLVIACSIVVFHLLGLYAAMVRYISANVIVSILLGILCSALLLFAANDVLAGTIPRTVPAIYCALAFPLISGSRFGIRALFNRRQNVRKENVFIYGAGSAGRQLLRTLQQDPAFNPVAFLDDSTQLHKVSVAGLRVYPPQQLKTLTERFGARRVLLAIPSADPALRRSILARLGDMQVQVQTIPGISDIMSGKARIDDLRSVAVEDLLGREPVPPLEPLLDANLRGKSVMVTGAGGSIGSELCRQAIERGLSRLILIETSEFALYSIDAELRRLLGDKDIQLEIIPLLLSVQSVEAMATAMRRFQVQTVYHAAAYKHVPLVEHNVIESIRNNVFGTFATATAAVEAGVDSFILVSTDKAVRPTNYMGATKRMAELICQAMAERQKRTRFAMVRFGNVLGSSGSVIPHFRQQIEAGGPVTVTHPEVTRYFMTIPEAALLVLQAGAMARGGDVFVLDMGEPIAIVDLASRMISLSGFAPYFPDTAEAPPQPNDIAITFTQLRTGEKLYEELLIGNNAAPTQHPRIMSAQEEKLSWAALQTVLSELESACNALDLPRVRQLLTAAPTGFTPAEEIVDHAWTNRDADARPAVIYHDRMSAAE